LQINQDCNSFAGFNCRLTDAVKPGLVLFIGSMRKVEASHIHSSCDEFSHLLWRFNGWTHRAYNFRAAHVRTLSINK
jgi:hypothetical protein